MDEKLYTLCRRHSCQCLRVLTCEWAEHTRFQKVVWLLVADSLFTCSIRPPWRSLLVSFRVWMMGLLLGLDQLDKSFSHDLARGLLHVFESNEVEFFYFGFVSYHQLLGFLNWDWHRGVVVRAAVSYRVQRAPRSFSFRTCWFIVI